MKTNLCGGEPPASLSGRSARLWGKARLRAFPHNLIHQRPRRKAGQAQGLPRFGVVAGVCPGFTLLELLTVMAIMLLLMGAAFGAFHGFLRGASIRSATLNLHSTLSLARQYAVTRRCTTHVLFWQDSTNAHYVICMEGGQHVGEDNTAFLTMETPHSGLVGADIFNITKETEGFVVQQLSDSVVRAGRAANTNSDILWDSGDRYGWTLRHQTHLPDGIFYTNGVPLLGGAPSKVSFKSDGTTPRGLGAPYTVEFAERAARNPARKTITVQGLTGQISVE